MINGSDKFDKNKSHPKKLSTTNIRRPSISTLGPRGVGLGVGGGGVVTHYNIFISFMTML